MSLACMVKRLARKEAASLETIRPQPVAGRSLSTVTRLAQMGEPYNWSAAVWPSFLQPAEAQAEDHFTPVVGSTAGKRY
jgi:hypothetical protein